MCIEKSVRNQVIIDKLRDQYSMPITPSGKKVLTKLKKQYGAKKGEEIFYAMISEKKKGSSKWHAKKK